MLHTVIIYNSLADRLLVCGILLRYVVVSSSLMPIHRYHLQLVS
jgi:hypothetical protein